MLAESLVHSDKNFNLFVYWDECYYHPLIFKIDIKTTIKNTYKILMRYFNEIFIKVLDNHLNFSVTTVILAMRRSRSGGMYVHVSEVKISHDDYIRLCFRMLDACFYKRDGVTIQLDHPHQMSLVACEYNFNDTSDHYVPVSVLQFENSRDASLSRPRKVERLNLKYYDPVTKSLFDRMKHPLSQAVDVARLMMPVLSPDDNSKTVYYPRRIFQTLDESRPSTRFLCYLNDKRYAFYTETKLCESETLDEPFCYRFLKRNARVIKLYYSSDDVVELWYKRFTIPKLKTHYPLNKINQDLRRECFRLKDDPNPIRTIVRDKDLAIPVFYALRNIFKDKYSPEEILAILAKFHAPLKEILTPITVRLKENDYLTPTRCLYFETILYCAHQINSNQTKDLHFWKIFGLGWDWILECTQTEKEMQMHIKTIQEKLFPVKKTKNDTIAWDPFIGKWLVIQSIDDFKTIVLTIYRIITYFDGYIKIPIKLRTELNKSDDWMITAANSMKKEVEEYSREVSLQKIPMWNNKYFGINVPSYYLDDLSINGI